MTKFISPGRARPVFRLDLRYCFSYHL